MSLWSDTKRMIDSLFYSDKEDYAFENLSDWVVSLIASLVGAWIMIFIPWPVLFYPAEFLAEFSRLGPLDATNQKWMLGFPILLIYAGWFFAIVSALYLSALRSLGLSGPLTTIIGIAIVQVGLNLVLLFKNFEFVFLGVLLGTYLTIHILPAWAVLRWTGRIRPPRVAARGIK